MGCVCVCLRDECEEFTNPNSSGYRNCICVSCFLPYLLRLYSSLFIRQDQNALPSTSHGSSSLTSIASLDNSLSDTYRSPPRPLPYDTDPRYFRSQRDGLVSRRGEKGCSHSHEETEPLRRNEVDGDEQESENVGNNNGGKWNESICIEESKGCNTRSSLKLSASKTSGAGFAHLYSSSDDDDICPTCLDEYTNENPKIVTKCSHHFHLGCIYEWMERSESCPVCGKVMAFDETP